MVVHLEWLTAAMYRTITQYPIWNIKMCTRLSPLFIKVLNFNKMGLVGIHSCWAAAQVSFYRVYALWSVTPHWEILILERINYKLRYSIYKDQTLFLNRWMIRYFISWFHFSKWYQICSADGNIPWIRIICKFYRNTFV